MRAYYSGLAAGVVLVVLMLAGGTAFGGLTAYWSFDSDLTSAGSASGMDGVLLGTGASIDPGAAKVGGGGLMIDDSSTDGIQHGVRINNTIASITTPITNPATDIPIITVAGWYNRVGIDMFGDMDSWNYIWESGLYDEVADNNFTVSASIRYDNTRWGYDTRGAVGSTFNDVTGPSINNGEWNHIVTVLNPTTHRAKYYHNGVLRDSRVITDEYLVALAASEHFHIGCSRYDYLNRNFEGYIDEVAVFDHEPSAEMIAALYDGTYTPATLPGDQAPAPSLDIVETDWTLSNTINFSRPAGMAVNPSDNHLYVARRHDTPDGGLYRIESDGSATQLAEAARPYGLAIDASGNIFMAQDGAGTISKWGGLLLDTWVSELNGDTSDDDPTTIVIVPDNFDGGVGSQVSAGDGLMVDRGSGGFEKVFIWSTSTAEGEIILHDDADAADGVGSPLIDPQGLAVTNSGIYVSDRLADAIFSISPIDGTATALTTSSPIISPIGIAADPISGDLYVITDEEDVAGTKLLRVNPLTGDVTTVIDQLADMDEDTVISQWPTVYFSSNGAHLYVVEPDAEIIYDLYRPVEEIPGDTNHDGRVDSVDAQKVAMNWGAPTTNGADDGDFDGDEIVGPRDAAIMAANWHYGVPAESTAVPEPSTLMALLGMATAALLLGRRR
ncbi:MAG: PEP-CTERM sorting domain-containing protein [Pirellulales bacterium]|nr:PEP-CTERM sorting domain-containing protein [Pirellulales bacterium]